MPDPNSACCRTWGQVLLWERLVTGAYVLCPLSARDSLELGGNGSLLQDRWIPAALFGLCVLAIIVLQPRWI